MIERVNRIVISDFDASVGRSLLDLFILKGFVNSGQGEIIANFGFNYHFIQRAASMK